MAKKKVSFDIEEADLAAIKAYCEVKKINFSDFLRAAAIEKYKFDSNYMTIYILDVGRIKRYVVEKARYNIELFVPDEDLAELAGAKYEGMIGFRNPEEAEIKDTIDFVLVDSPSGRVRFFTR